MTSEAKLEFINDERNGKLEVLAPRAGSSWRGYRGVWMLFEVRYGDDTFEDEADREWDDKARKQALACMRSLGAVEIYDHEFPEREE